MEAALNGPQGRILLGPTPLTLGRAPDNQFVLTDSKASGHHAEISTDGQHFFVLDKGSTNGTFVNEQQLVPNVPRQLNANDIIRVGTTTFTYESNEPEAAPTIYTPPFVSDTPTYQPTAPAPLAYPETVAAPSPYQETIAAPPPPPPYNQQAQGYDVPPLAAYPNYAPPAPAPAQPAKKRRSRLWMTLGIVAAVIVVLCAALGILGYIVRSTPEKTLSTFCNDLQSNNDADAYQQLSSGLQARESEATFTNQMQQLTALTRGIKSCTSGVVSSNSTNAIGVMDWSVNATSRPIPFNVGLINENGTWKISALRLQQGG